MGKVSKKLLKLIAKKDIISFDIFDTLIKRNCNNPKDVFKIVERKYNNRFENKIKNFYSNRIDAEKRAREVYSTSEDVTFEQIYEQLSYSKKIKSILMDLEIETEYEICQKNINMYPVYQECCKKNKRIICITDMYLPKQIIINILKKCGYDIEDVFVSSEYCKTKLSGNLYKIAMKDLNIKKSKMLHIGDSWKADFVGAIKCGIKSYHIPKKVSNSFFVNDDDIDDLSINIMTTFIQNNIIANKDYYEKLGYEIVGPMCYLMCMWFYQESKKNNVDNLLFCARDMKLVHEIFDLIYNKEIKSNYFYVSRKSTYLPFLYKNNSYEDFKKLIPNGGRRKIAIVELLDMYNIDIPRLDRVLVEYNLDYNERYDLEEIKENSDFKKFYENIVLKFINSEGKVQYNNFLSYLNSLSFTDKSAIVDLGWRGTTQNIMIDILGYDIKGMYLGLHSLNGDNLKNNYFTYLFSSKDELYSQKVYACMSLCELLLSALHGSTISYSNAKDKPYILNNSANCNNKQIELIQKGALDFCKEIIKYKDILENSDSKKFINLFISIGVNPTYKQAKNLGEIYTENIKTRKLAKPEKMIKYILNPKKMKDDLIDSEWKIGFMKRMFKIKLPYFKLYCFLKKKGE